MQYVNGLLTLFFLSFHIGAATDRVDEYCDIVLNQAADSSDSERLTPDGVLRLKLPQGKSVISLDCHLNHHYIFNFQRFELLSYRFNDQHGDSANILLAQPSFLLPVGAFTGEIEFDTRREVDPAFKMLPITTYIEQNQKRTLVAGAFYGFCLTLILYILIMGRSLGRQPFHLYSLYLSFASMFYLLQEGHLNLFFPHSDIVNHHNTHLMFAGLTVITFVRFLIRLLELDKYYPRYTKFLLLGPAWLVCLVPFLTLFVDSMPMVYAMSQFMALLVLLLGGTILAVSGWAAYHRVHTAPLVVMSFSVILVAFILRAWLLDISPFLSRYGLLMAFTVESFILAIATSERVKQISRELLLAEQEAISDQLCSILNRRGWEKFANELLQQHKQQGGYLCMIYIDVNDFKHVNDQYGHQVGDEVLKIISKILNNQIREVDAAGRLGGDEFVALALFDYRQKGEQLVTRLQKRLGTLSIKTSGLKVSVSASVGHVIFDESPESVSDMLRQGDKSMYQVKRAYHNVKA